MLKLGQLRESLRTSLWFVPTVCVVVAIVGSQALVRLQTEATGPWRFGGGAESARTLLSTLAASMITFLGLTFSITMVVLQLTSSQYSPRVLRTFLRDRQSQWTLGIFVATFVYVVLVLREVRGTVSQAEQFVPGPAITVAFVLLLASLGAFVAYINHMAQSIRPETIIESVAAETRSLIDRRPDLGDDDPPAADDAGSRRSGAEARVTSSHEGMLQSVDVDRLEGIARREHVGVSVLPRVGDFVPFGCTLFEVRCDDDTAADSEGMADELRSCVVTGRDRTMQQDLAFGFRQLVDIGVRALSPGINDPTTAVQVIDRIHGLLRRLATKADAPTARRDADGVVRVELAAARWADLVHLSFDEIRHYGGGSVQVLRRVRAALDDLDAAVPDGRREPVAEQLHLLRAAAARSFPDAGDREYAARPDEQGIGSDGVG